MYVVTEGCMLGVRGFVRCDRGYMLGVEGFVRCDRGMYVRSKRVCTL